MNLGKQALASPEWWLVYLKVGRPHPSLCVSVAPVHAIL